MPRILPPPPVFQSGTGISGVTGPTGPKGPIGSWADFDEAKVRIEQLEQNNLDMEYRVRHLESLVKMLLPSDAEDTMEEDETSR